MSRIRSIHPGQWTDDRFITCSPLARLLALALRNEADDNGIFEWNPVKLKVRLLPMDSCDVAALLQELVDTDQVWRFEHDGRAFGMIRNFQVWQKPRAATFYHFAPKGTLPAGYAVHSEYDDAKVKNQFRSKQRPTDINAEPMRQQCCNEAASKGVRTPKEEGEGDGDVGSREERTSNSADAEALVSEWNAMAERCGLPKVRDVTDKRKRAIAARLRDRRWRLEYPDGLRKIGESDFLRGRVRGKPWKADLDWFLKPDSLTKILEGVYDGGNGAIRYEGDEVTDPWPQSAE
jgi:hypothetical protein